MYHEGVCVVMMTSQSIIFFKFAFLESGDCTLFKRKLAPFLSTSKNLIFLGKDDITLDACL